MFNLWSCVYNAIICASEHETSKSFKGTLLDVSWMQSINLGLFSRLQDSKVQKYLLIYFVKGSKVFGEMTLFHAPEFFTKVMNAKKKERAECQEMHVIYWFSRRALSALKTFNRFINWCLNAGSWDHIHFFGQIFLKHAKHFKNGELFLTRHDGMSKKHPSNVLYIYKLELETTLKAS